MAPGGKKSNFTGVGKSIGGKVVQPKGKRAQQAMGDAAYYPYNDPTENVVDDSDLEDVDLDDEEVQALVEQCRVYWDVEENVEVHPDIKKELERRLKAGHKLKAFTDQIDENATRAGTRLAQIIATYEKQASDPMADPGPIIDASDRSVGENVPANKVGFVLCLNGSYRREEDGSFEEIKRRDKKWPCPCPICSARAKNSTKLVKTYLRNGKNISK